MSLKQRKSGAFFRDLKRRTLATSKAMKGKGEQLTRT
jgi:hypothetical protein